MFIVWVATGCLVEAETSFRGRIADEVPSFADAIFAQQVAFFDDGDDLVVVRLGPAGLCETSTATEEAFNALFAAPYLTEEDVQNYVETWRANFAPDFWQLQLFLRVSAAADPLGGAVLEGTSWDLPLTATDLVAGQISHYVAHPEFADLVGANFDYVQEFATDGGELRVTGHVPGQSLAARFGPFDSVDGDGVDEGSALRLTFTAARCPSWEAARFAR